MDDNKRYYVFTNIHGSLPALETVFTLIEEDIVKHKNSQSVVIAMGDYIDHGPDSKEIIDILISPPPIANEFHCLMGNHEHMLLNFCQSVQEAPLWLTRGGLATLLSYGVSCTDYTETLDEIDLIQQALLEKMPDSHRKFFDELQLYHETPDFLFTHAGAHPKNDISAQSHDDLLWRKDAEPNESHAHNKCIVHTHNHLSELRIEPNRICINAAHQADSAHSCILLGKNIQPTALKPADSQPY